MSDVAAFVTEASQRFGLPEHWIYAVMRTESAGRTTALSHAGAMGLMQLMPRTWTRQRLKLGLGTDPFDPRDNILAGSAYLREMYDSFGSPGFLAAYNAGPGRYLEWRDHGRVLPAETRAYVARIAPQLHPHGAHSASTGAAGVQQGIRPWTQSSLFAARTSKPGEVADRSTNTASTTSQSLPSPSPGGMFVPLASGGPR